MRSFASRLKHRIFYRSAPLFYVYERFMHRRYGMGRPGEEIVGPSGKRFPIAELMRELRDKGICSLPGYYSPEQADALYGEVIAWNEHVKDGRIPADDKGDLFSGKVVWAKNLHAQGIIRIHNVQKLGERCAVFHRDPNFIRLGGLYTGKPIININTISQYNEPIPAGCRGYHFDSYLNQFKSFVYLNDVTEENGPHDYRVGSNAVTRANMRRAYMSIRSENTSVSDAEAEATGYPHRTFPGERGTVLLVDTRGIHQGANLKTGHRLALTGYWYLKEDWPQFSGD